MILKEFGILLAEEIFLRKNFILFLVTSFYSVFFFFWLHHLAYRILLVQLGPEPKFYE